MPLEEHIGRLGAGGRLPISARISRSNLTSRSSDQAFAGDPVLSGAAMSPIFTPDSTGAEKGKFIAAGDGIARQQIAWIFSSRLGRAPIQPISSALQCDRGKAIAGPCTRAWQTSRSGLQKTGSRDGKDKNDAPMLARLLPPLLDTRRGHCIDVGRCDPPKGVRRRKRLRRVSGRKA